MGIDFAAPWMALLFLPLGFAAWRLLRRGRRSGIRFSAVGRIPPRAAGWRAIVAQKAPYLLLAGLAALVLAGMRPRSSLAHASSSVDALAIAMTIDVSGSMEALDLAPPSALAGLQQRYVTESERETVLEKWSRLARVKSVFADFISRRPDDLISLVTFGSYASARVPLTADHAMLLHALKGVDIPRTAYDAQGRTIGEDEANTAIGDGLSVALLRLMKAKPVSKVVILLSDGQNNTGVNDPDEVAAQAAKLGIRVYVIGVGTRASRTPFLMRVPSLMGPSSYVLRAANTAYDERQLKSIAERTGAAYYSVNDGDSLAKALAEIDQLEKTKIDVDAWDRWDEHFVPFLVSGTLLVLLAVSLSMAASRRPA
ncbi:MAG: VWA domain-containing protein [Kiritimatiellia bacterium]